MNANLNTSASFYNVESLKTIAKKEVPEGNRLSRIVFKDVKKNGVVVESKESKGLWVPQITDAAVQYVATNEIGIEYLRAAIAGVQDSIIRKYVAAGRLTVSSDQIGIADILDAMKTATESERFTKESIAKWFSEFLKEPLADAIRNKMEGISQSHLDKLLGNYVENFQILAGRNPSMSNVIKAGLIRAMEFLPEDHDSITACTIAEKLAAVSEASVELCAL